MALWQLYIPNVSVQGPTIRLIFSWKHLCIDYSLVNMPLRNVHVGSVNDGDLRQRRRGGRRGVWLWLAGRMSWRVLLPSDIRIIIIIIIIFGSSRATLYSSTWRQVQVSNVAVISLVRDFHECFCITASPGDRVTVSMLLFLVVCVSWFVYNLFVCL